MDKPIPFTPFTFEITVYNRIMDFKMEDGAVIKGVAHKDYASSVEELYSLKKFYETCYPKPNYTVRWELCESFEGDRNFKAVKDE